MPSRKHLRFPNVKDKPVVIVFFLFFFLNANSCNFMEYSINFPLFFLYTNQFEMDLFFFS